MSRFSVLWLFVSAAAGPPVPARRLSGIPLQCVVSFTIVTNVLQFGGGGVPVPCVPDRRLLHGAGAAEWQFPLAKNRVRHAEPVAGGGRGVSQPCREGPPVGRPRRRLGSR